VVNSAGSKRHSIAVIQAIVVTLLWSSSWILVKYGLESIPPLTFAGLRYSVAFVVLVPFAVRSRSWSRLKRLGRKQWVVLLVLGIVFYSFTQGAQFVALSYLPAQTTSLFLSFTPIAVAIGSTIFLKERPRIIQFVGTCGYLLGAFLFLLPLSGSSRRPIGFIVAGVGVLANATASLLGRYVNRSLGLPPIMVTTITMGIGGIILLAGGISVQGLPILSWEHYLIILWLSIINTAFAFTMWNATLVHLSALESSLINNTMLIQIAILAWMFLGESLNGRRIFALGIAAISIALVQLFSSREA
jgi:drug/metabolite transporter (DMT)-like permease